VFPRFESYAALVVNRNHPCHDSNPLLHSIYSRIGGENPKTPKADALFFSAFRLKKKGIAHDRTHGRFQASGEKSALDAPHTGHSQLSGTFSNGVLAGTPLSGSPRAGSYT
jgi:hypothetical protein